MSNPLSLIMKVVEYGKSPPKGPAGTGETTLPSSAQHAFKVPEITVGKPGKLSREASFNWDFDDSPTGVDTGPSGAAHLSLSSGGGDSAGHR